VHTKFMKWIAVVTLFLAVLGFPIVSQRAILEIVVCVSALLVATQAIWTSKYFWAAGFSTIAVLFNPLVPFPITGNAFVLLEWVCLAAFLVSLAVLKLQPTLSVLSITSRAPRTESL
jgi:Family of unknown function (DUF6804)